MYNIFTPDDGITYGIDGKRIYVDEQSFASLYKIRIRRKASGQAAAGWGNENVKLVAPVVEYEHIWILCW